MFRKRIGDQSESKIDSDKYLLKKIKLDLPGHGEGLFGLYTLLNAVIDLDQFKLTIVCFRTYSTRCFVHPIYNTVCCSIPKLVLDIRIFLKSRVEEFFLEIIL